MLQWRYEIAIQFQMNISIFMAVTSCRYSNAEPRFQIRLNVGHK